MQLLRMGFFAIAGGSSLIFVSPGNGIASALIIAAVLLIAALVIMLKHMATRVAPRRPSTKGQRFVLAHPQLGVYLGAHGPIGLWSGLNLAGRRDAHTFASVYDAREVIRRYCAAHTNLHASAFSIKRVTTQQRHLPLRECARIGMPVLVAGLT